MPGPNTPLFSPTALDELNSRAKTDSLTNVISNWIWFILAAISLAGGALLYWGFLGSMADSIQGVGITIRRGGVEAVIARGSGLVETLTIAPGDTVARNDIIGHVYNVQDFFALSRLEEEYRQLGDYLDLMEQGFGRLSALAATVEQQKQRELESLQKKLEANRQRNLELSEIFRQGSVINVVTKIDYYRSLEQTLQIESSIISILQQSMDSELQRNAIEWQNEQLLLQGLRERQLKRQELSLAVKMSLENAWLRADSEGVVIEVLRDVGDHVAPGDKIALISTSSTSDLRVVGFVPIEQGKKVRPGMSAFFSPSSFPAREYGYIRGVVLETSPFAVSSASIEAELKNPDLARSISHNSVQMRVVVELLPDKAAASNYKWTSRGGAPSPLEAGTYGSLLINTESRSPASYVMPFLRQNVLGVGEEGKGAARQRGGESGR